MDDGLKDEVIDLVGRGLSITEIHRLLTAEGKTLTRLELRLLLSDLERGATVISPQSMGTVEQADNFVPLRERYVSKNLPVWLRWLLFIPAGLGAGVLCWVSLLIVAPNSGDEDVIGFGGMVAGMVGGFITVFVGIVVAPRSARVVASVMGIVAAFFTGAIIFLLWRKLGDANRIVMLLAGATYACSTVISAIIWMKQDAVGSPKSCLVKQNDQPSRARCGSSDTSI